MTDATTALIRAIGVTFVTFRTEEIRSRAWMSATFAGVRHEILFRIEGPTALAEADRFLDGLEDREFELRGHILADIALASRSSDPSDGSVRIGIEALTLEDC